MRQVGKKLFDEWLAGTERSGAVLLTMLFVCLVLSECWIVMHMYASAAPTWKFVEAVLFPLCVAAGLLQVGKSSLAFIFPASYLLWMLIINKAMGWQL